MQTPLRASFTATIGRNQNTTPMPLPEWNRFIQDTHDQLILLQAEIFSEGATGSFYAESPEEGHIWAGTIPEPHLPPLRSRLAALATVYGQEAIGLIVQLNTDTLVLAV